MPAHISGTQPTTSGEEQRNVSLDKRLAAAFWALLFIIAGVLWLFPEGQLPDGTWLIGIGLILLALNAVRLLNGIPVRRLPATLGGLALAAGVAASSGVKLPLISLTLIAIGASIVLELFPLRRS